MKIPQRPPASDLWSLLQNQALYAVMRTQVTGPTVNGRYVHWDKLRRLSAPEGLDHPTWWAGLKFERDPGRKAIGLLDSLGQPFSYILADPLHERLHEADSNARGMIGSPDLQTR